MKAAFLPMWEGRPSLEGIFFCDRMLTWRDNRHRSPKKI